ncbi:hypothetical protein [Streptomyces sp. ME19-01-6]|uniref:hypothetical protein n=1 Tax=Streptomyces sp. ME19-01-6 TaxID=3028686 RepID=UPI0029A22106|nr:hypothetical protein [Streptomyces sp. ME19-01-6]MDX3226102.1 hypothetical protein [Streptomyces sp. ME19-01-6]
MTVLSLLTTVLLGLGGLGAVAVVYVVIVTIEYLADWFRARSDRLQLDPDLRCVTVAESIRDGKVSYIQGVFDTSREQFVESRRVKGERADERVRGAHRTHQVAVWG